MKDKVDLKEILIKELSAYEWTLCETLTNSILSAMKTACDQTVDLCAENAQLKMIGERKEYGPAPTWYSVLDKESILKTKDQIK
jgi:hypothetical protein